MALFKQTQSILDSIKESPFKLERDIQRIFENNLLQIMCLEMVKSEFSIKNRRIDTLGFDPQTKSFVIIEYKRERNNSVVDQGFTYLNLMLQNKADFILEYNEGLKKTLKRDDVDWSQTRVAFVSQGFTENQREATNFKDIAIELWEVKQYEGGIVSINQIKKSSAAESIKAITDRNTELQEITKEIKVYTEEDHLNGKPDETVELYEKFKSAILDLSPDIEIKPQKWYIAFKKNGTNVSDIEIQKNTIKISVNLKVGKLDDPKHLMRDVSVLKGHSLNGDYELRVDSDKDLQYIMSLVKQAVII
jgi:predicted transport protein